MRLTGSPCCTCTSWRRMPWASLTHRHCRRLCKSRRRSRCTPRKRSGRTPRGWQRRCSKRRLSLPWHTAQRTLPQVSARHATQVGGEVAMILDSMSNERERAYEARPFRAYVIEVCSRLPEPHLPQPPPSRPWCRNSFSPPGGDEQSSVRLGPGALQRECKGHRAEGFCQERAFVSRGGSRSAVFRGCLKMYT